MRNSPYLTGAILLSAGLLGLHPAQAAIVNWDTSSAAGFQSGSGTWGADHFWSGDGTTLSPWVSGDQAVFLGETTAVNDTISLGSVQNLTGLTFGSATTAGNWTFSGSGMALTANSTFNVNAGSTASIGNIISGAFSLTKAGTGGLTLTGANTYTGATTVSAGTLTLAAGGSMGAGALSVASGASLVLNASTATSSLTGAGAVAIGEGATLTLNTTAGGPQFHGTFSGAGSLVKSGAGEVLLAGDNSGFTGAITINGGMISAQNLVSTLGSGDITVTANATIGAYAGGVFAAGRLNNRITVTAGTLTLGRNGTTTLGGDVVAIGAGSILVGGGGTVVIERDIRTLGTGTLSVAAGTTLQLGNGGVTGTFNGGLSFDHSAGSLIFNRSDNITYSGVLSGAGNLTKLGTGGLTLTGANAYAGSTTVSAGTLTLAAGGSMGAGALSVASGASLVLNASAATPTLTGAGAVAIAEGATLTLNTTAGSPQFHGTFSGAGSLVKSGAGEVLLTGNNSGLTGAITINGGMISAQNLVSTLGSGDITVTANATIGAYAGGVFAAGRLNNRITVTAGTLTLGRNGTTTLGGDVVATGQASILVAGGGTTVFERELFNNGTGTLGLSAGTTLQVGGGGATGALRGNLSSAGSLVFNRSDNITYSGVLSGTGSLTKAGLGNLILTGANTYTGTTTVSAGTLTLAAGGTMSAGALAVAAGAGLVLDVSATTSTLTGAGTVAIAEGATLTLNTTTGYPQFHGTFSGPGALVKSGAGEVLLTGNNSGLTGAITLNGGMISVQNPISTLGSGDITVTANATIGAYSGSGLSAGRVNNRITVTAGTLTLGRNGTTTLGGDVVATGQGSILVGGGGTTVLERDLFNHGTGTLRLSGGTTLQVGGGGATGALRANLSLAGNLVFNRADSSTCEVILSGTGNLAQVGSGSLTLTGSNSYSGGTTIMAGTLIVGSDTALGSGAVKVTGGTLDLGSRSFANTITLSSGSLAGTRLDAATLILQGGEVTGSIVSGSLSKTTNETAILSGANTYAGGTTVAAGTLVVNNAGALGSGNVTLAGGGLDVKSLTIAKAITLTADSKVAGTDGAITGIISGNGLLTKVGAGTLTLGGHSTFVGGTVINAGTLQVTGSILGNLVVSAGGTLAGSGNLGDITVTAGGSIGAGLVGAVGSLSADTLSLQGGAKVELNFSDASLGGGSGFDRFLLSGQLDLSAVSVGNKLTLLLTGLPTTFDPAGSYSFGFIRYGTLNLGANGNISDLFTIDASGLKDQFGGSLDASNFSLVDDAANHQVRLNHLSAIPEPSTYGLSLGCLGLAVAAVRRRRRLAPV